MKDALNDSAKGLDRITITRPDDWHVHLRDGGQLWDAVQHVPPFGRALVMPNLKPPVTTVALALEYRAKILRRLERQGGKRFEPLMTLYLTDETTPEEIRKAKESGVIPAVKYYPAGATTNSENGVTDIGLMGPVFDALEEHGITLCLHGEVTNADVDIFDREMRFIDRHLDPLTRQRPGLKIVVEHITTAFAVQFVRVAGAHVAATITAHHLLSNRNALFAGGLRPHAYCLPILKREDDRRALLAAATSGNPKFFAGTDSAPHPRHAKESACGCAGTFMPYGIQAYAEAFDSEDRLDRLQGFASEFGAEFYGMDPNSDTITLVRRPWEVAHSLEFGGDTVVPFRAGEKMEWVVAE